jgi:hypothetical protein
MLVSFWRHISGITQKKDHLLSLGNLMELDDESDTFCLGAWRFTARPTARIGSGQ